jgi:hypothetical protein
MQRCVQQCVQRPVQRRVCIVVVLQAVACIVPV